MKKSFFTLCFSFFLYLHADSPGNLLTVLAYRDTACSVILNVDEVCCGISFENAARMIGTGSEAYPLGNLSMYLFYNDSTMPVYLNLVSTTYDAANQRYVAYNGSASIVIGVQKAFDQNGERTSYSYIDPTTNPVVIRTSSSNIKSESHTLYFYILESPDNTFVDGTYTASFELYFST